MPRAVIYVRVSTTEQLNNMSLPYQEDQCREYCRREGWEVVELFREEGESAKTVNRTELQKLLAYCDLNRKKAPVDYVVVYNVQRFSRNALDHHALRAALAKNGVQLRSVTEPIDESPEGQMMEGVFATLAQYDNALRSRRTLGGMREGAARGRWMWKVPIGYLRAGKGHLIHDPERAPLIAYAFERMASGEVTQAELLQEVTALGLVSQKGRPLKKQRFSAMLANPLYAGRVVSKTLGVDAPGEFEPIVSDEVFGAVQDVLSGRRPSKPTRKLDNPEFPLRRIVKCGLCGTPMTGSFSTARNKERHPYYRCRNSDCRGVNVRREALHLSLVTLLESHVVRHEVMTLFVAQVEAVWKGRGDAARAARARLEARLAGLEAKSDALVDKLADGSLSRAQFQRAMLRNEADQRAVREQFEVALPSEIDLASTLDFARSLLGNLSEVWNRLSAKQKPSFLKALYPSGLMYQDGTVGTAETPWIVTAVAAIPDDLSGFDLDPLSRAISCESLVVSYREVVHAQALSPGVSTSGLCTSRRR